MNLFINEKQAKLTAKTRSPAAALVWLTLFTLASGRDGSVLFASKTRLRKLTGLSINTVKSALRALLDEGLLEVRNAGRIPTYTVPHVMT